jgi:hypothetical protein
MGPMTAAVQHLDVQPQWMTTRYSLRIRYSGGLVVQGAEAVAVVYCFRGAVLEAEGPAPELPEFTPGG